MYLKRAPRLRGLFFGENTGIRGIPRFCEPNLNFKMVIPRIRALSFTCLSGIFLSRLRSFRFFDYRSELKALRPLILTQILRLSSSELRTKGASGTKDGRTRSSLRGPFDFAQDKLIPSLTRGAASGVCMRMSQSRVIK